MTLYEEIISLPELLAMGDHGAIAKELSRGRKKVIPMEIGKGKILEVIGLATANSLLDVIDSHPDYRHVKQLLQNGWFNIGSPLARASVDALVVAGIINEIEGTAIKAIAEVDDVITSQEVTKALEGH